MLSRPKSLGLRYSSRRPHLNWCYKKRRRNPIDLSFFTSIGGESTLSNAHSALLLVFMLACFESLIGIGLFVSGVFLLGVASYLLSQELISGTQLAISAAAGAMLGDHVGFFFGRFLGPRLHHSRTTTPPYTSLYSPCRSYSENRKYDRSVGRNRGANRSIRARDSQHRPSATWDKRIRS